MKPNVAVLVAMSFSGIAAWRPISGVWQRLVSTSSQYIHPLSAPDTARTWNKHPMPIAAISRYTTFSAL